MESNVISLSAFREVKIQNEIQVSNSSEALALDESRNVFFCDMMEVVKERLFTSIPEYRFIVEDGEWDGDYEGDKPFTVQVRLKGTDISGLGCNEAGAWIRLTARLTEEGMLRDGRRI